jgi:uncharacterized membrane protein
MTMTDETTTSGSTATGPSAEERQERLRAGADKIAAGQRSILAHPKFLLALASTLMTFGVTLIVLGWVGAAHSTFVEEQVPYLISGGLLGVALATIGALLVFTHWLTVSIREERTREAMRRQDHIELMEALALLATSIDRREVSDGTARGEGAQRPVRRAPRRS